MTKNHSVIISVLLLIGLTVGLVSVGLMATAASVKIGDVDRSGDVNFTDRTVLARYLADWDDYRDIDKDAADVDRNHEVSFNDRTILARYLAGWDGYESYFNDPSAASSTASTASGIRYNSDNSGWTSRWY